MASLYVDVVNNNIEACMKAACMRAGMAQDVVPKALEFQRILSTRQTSLGVSLNYSCVICLHLATSLAENGKQVDLKWMIKIAGARNQNHYQQTYQEFEKALKLNPVQILVTSPNLVNNNMKFKPCKLHKLPMNQFCKHDEVLVCCKCLIYGQHAGHVSLDLESVNQRKEYDRFISNRGEERKKMVSDLKRAQNAVEMSNSAIASAETALATAKLAGDKAKAALETARLALESRLEHPDEASEEVNYLKQSKRVRFSCDMTIKVKQLTGRDIDLNVEPSDTVKNIRTKIHSKEGIPPPQFHLIFGGQRLKDEKTLADYNIVDKSVLYLTLRLSGGGGGEIETFKIEKV